LMEDIAFEMPFGIVKTDMKYRGREFKTDLIRHILPAMLRNFPFHLLNFALIVDITGFQVESLVGLAPRGSPRYVIGKVSLRQKIALARPEVYSLSKLIPISELL